MNHYIQVSDLVIQSGANSLVKGISFTAEKGRVTGLIGESGSGKSLTCQSILGMLPQNLSATGNVTIAGTAMPMGSSSACRKARGKNVSMVMQNPISCFDPVFNIGSHFKETLSAHEVPKAENTPAKWCQALTEVGFDTPEEIVTLYPFQMSGGMLQRVMIAISLVLEADFLLADEATTDLDAISQARVLKLLESLVRQRNMGALLVTHDLSVIARLADHVLVMKKGVIVDRGSVDSIFHSPQHEYTVALLKAHYRLHGIEAPPHRGHNTNRQTFSP
ncbi:MAG: ATP-binding cassette domain-containing protein [Desulfovibrio sp.]